MLSLTIRRAIYLTFILLFFITAPLLVLYTAGYRFNPKKNSVQKVGSLSVKPTPSTAEIYLNGALQTGSRPDNTLRLNNLFPGRYRITVSQDGYYPWEKTLEVFSNVNTFVNRSVLFKRAVPENIINQKITDALISPDGKTIAYLTADQLATINLYNLQIKNQVTAANGFELLSWSPSSDKILVKNNLGQLVIYYPDNPQAPLALQTIISSPLKNVRWDEKNDYLLSGLADNTLYQINILTKDYRMLYRFPQLTDQAYGPDFFYQNNKIYYTLKDKDGLHLEKIDLGEANEKKSLERLMKLPTSGSFKFSPNANGTVCLVDQEKGELYLVDQNFSQLILEAAAKNFSWSNDGQSLLYYNDFEIYLFDLATKKVELITRYGQTIKSAAFIPGVDYLVVLLDNSLEIIEQDGRDNRNVIKLLTGQGLTNFYLDAKNENIFFIGRIASQPGLFKLNIQ